MPLYVCGRFGKKNDDECFTSYIGDHSEQICERDSRTERGRESEKNKPKCVKLLKINNAPRDLNIPFEKLWPEHKVCTATTCQNVVGKKIVRPDREFV